MNTEVKISAENSSPKNKRLMKISAISTNVVP